MRARYLSETEKAVLREARGRRWRSTARQQHEGMPLAEALRAFQEARGRLVSKIETMTTEDLLKPYRTYQPESKSEDPVYGWIIGNSYGHYAEHRPWIAAIVASR